MSKEEAFTEGCPAREESSAWQGEPVPSVRAGTVLAGLAISFASMLVGMTVVSWWTAEVADEKADVSVMVDSLHVPVGASIEMVVEFSPREDHERVTSRIWAEDGCAQVRSPLDLVRDVKAFQSYRVASWLTMRTNGPCVVSVALVSGDGGESAEMAVRDALLNP